MKIKLSKSIKGLPSNHAKRLEYKAGETVKVIPANNLPDDSPIKFWIAQDGWLDDPYGLAVYFDEIIKP